jgi:hypothetical protein
MPAKIAGAKEANNFSQILYEEKQTTKYQEMLHVQFLQMKDKKTE